MVYSSSKDNHEDLRESIGKVVKGLGLELLEANIFRSKKLARSVQVKLTVYKGIEPVSIDDCSKVHKAVLPRLELAFPLESAFHGDVDFGEIAQRPDIYVEVASPGVDRIIKEGSEFTHYNGREILCYRTDISDWTTGRLVSSDSEGIILNTNSGEIRLDYDKIGKAKLGRS